MAGTEQTEFHEIMARVFRLAGVTVPSGTAGEEYAIFGEYFNLILEEMQEAHQWTNLWERESIDTVAGQSYVDLTANQGRNMRLVYDPKQVANPTSQQVSDEIRPMVFNTSQNGHQLRERPYAELERKRAQNPQQNAPQYCALIPENTNDTMRLVLYPTPNTVYSLDVWTVRPTQWLDITDSTDDDHEVLVPTRPLILGILALITGDRGEEVSPTGTSAYARYQEALRDAIMIDIERQGGRDLEMV